jgi:hypothetical protein
MNGDTRIEKDSTGDPPIFPQGTVMDEPQSHHLSQRRCRVATRLGGFETRRAVKLATAYATMQHYFLKVELILLQSASEGTGEGQQSETETLDTACMQKMRFSGLSSLLFHL